MREFIVLVKGLQPQTSAFLQAYEQPPIVADDPAAIAAVFGSYLGPEAADVGDDGW